VKFIADIDGDPLPTVQWLFNGKQIVAGGFHLVSSQNLIIFCTPVISR